LCKPKPLDVCFVNVYVLFSFACGFACLHLQSRCQDFSFAWALSRLCRAAEDISLGFGALHFLQTSELQYKVQAWTFTGILVLNFQISCEKDWNKYLVFFEI
jgi:hypothetical protein